MNIGRIDALAKIMLHGKFHQCLASAGFPVEDYQLLTGEELWDAVDRPRVRPVMDAMMFAIQDLQGLQRVAIPAEYIAVCIAICVSPINWAIAASWYNMQAKTVQQIDTEEPESGVFNENITADRLFTLVLEYSAAEAEGRLTAVRDRMVGLLTPTPSVTKTNK